jgi:CRISPR system Cascade subunit CasE
MSVIHAAVAFPNPDHFSARADASDPYQMHRTLTRLFWNEHHSNEERAQLLRGARLLFRLETDRPSPWVFIQARIPFQWESIACDYWKRAPICATIAHPPAIGAELLFRLCARPTAGHKQKDIRDDEERYRWIHEKAISSGFEITHVSFDDVFWRDSKGCRSRLLRGAMFEGRLRVTDPDRLFRAMANGIGRGKAVGFGLLTLFEMKPFGF